MDIKKFLDNLKIKKFGKNQIFILFLCGVLLMIITIPVKDTEGEVEVTNSDTMSDSTEYANYLERRLEQILSQIEGAGDITCMVTLRTSAEQVVEKDMEISDDAVTEKDSQGGERSTNQSSRSETTIYTEENGKPYISKEISPKVEGVLILAEGGDNSVVVKNITEGIQALFGIESHKIRIVKKGG